MYASDRNAFVSAMYTASHQSIKRVLHIGHWRLASLDEQEKKPKNSKMRTSVSNEVSAFSFLGVSKFGPAHACAVKLLHRLTPMRQVANTSLLSFTLARRLRRSGMSVQELLNCTPVVLPSFFFHGVDLRLGSHLLSVQGGRHHKPCFWIMPVSHEVRR